jgi:FkbM family methyltransferase
MDIPAEYFCHSVAANQLTNSKTIKCALSDYNGCAIFFGSNQSEFSTLNQSFRHPDSKEITVEVKKLDDLCIETGFTNPDFIKMDVEGVETNVLAGGAQVFNEMSPLVMFEVIARGEIDLSAANHLRELSYDLYRFIPALNCLAPVDDIEKLDPDQLNLFGCKKDRREWLISNQLLPEILPEIGAEATSDVAFDTVSKLLDRFDDLIFADGFRKIWSSMKNSNANEDRYLSLLTMYFLSKEQHRTLTSRLKLLHRCYNEMLDLASIEPNPSRLSSLARIAQEFGMFRSARNIIAYIRKELDSVEGNLREPFLPASNRFDRISSADNPLNWFKASILEQDIKLEANSSIFGGKDHPKKLDSLRNYHYYGAEIERRWQLVQVNLGRQNGFTSNPLLTHLSPDNLNPQFWRTQ